MPYAEVGCMAGVMMAAGLRMPCLCKGTSQRVPGMRVGEGAAFLCFYDKFFWHFLPLFQGKKQSNRERTEKRTTSELRENIKNAEKS